MIKFILAATLLLSATYAWPQMNEQQRALVPARNELRNPGWEGGSGGWTASGGSYVQNIVPSSGRNSGSWDPSASSQTLTSDSYTITSNQGLSGRNGVISCMIKTAATDMKMQAYDGTNVLTANASTDVVPSSSAGFIRYTLNFIFPSSGTVALRFLSASNSAIAYIDDCFMGAAEGFNLGQVSQATFYGDARYAGTTNCSWTSTATSVASFSADSDCPAPTVTNNASAPATKIPGITFSNLPPGDYLVEAHFRAFTTGSGACFYRLYDGTTGGDVMNVTLPSDVVTTVAHKFNYTAAQSSKTFEVQVYKTSGTNCGINAATTDQDAYFTVTRYPSASELAYRADLSASRWAGYHDNTCLWSRTNASYGDPAADASCGFGERSNVNFGTVTSAVSGSDKLPGIVFTPTRPQTYFVCAMLIGDGTTGSTSNAIKLTDGTTVVGAVYPAATSSYGSHPICGFYNATSTASVTLKLQIKSTTAGTLIESAVENAIEWSIFSVDHNFPAPIFVGSVTSQSTGQERVERANITCSASSAINHQSGTWLTSVGNVSSGKCVVTLAVPFSSTAYDCFFTRNGTAVTSIVGASINNKATGSFDLYMALISSGSSTIAAATTESFDMKCMGPK